MICFAETETGETFNPNVTAYTLELPDYRNKSEKEQYTDTETWIYNIANLEKMKGNLPFTERQPAFKRLQEKARRGNLTPEEDIEYERSLKAHRDYLACLHFAQVNGMEIGKAEGLEQGIKQGIEQGIDMNRISTAKAAKAEGLGIDIIVKLTGLTPEQIAEL